MLCSGSVVGESGTARWLAIIAGAAGFGFQHYYGMAKRPGGYKWLLHYLMYGAPQLAPLALAATCALALMAARGLAGGANFAGGRHTRPAAGAGRRRFGDDLPFVS